MLDSGDEEQLEMKPLDNKSKPSYDGTENEEETRKDPNDYELIDGKDED